MNTQPNAAAFLADLAMGVSDAEMRIRWKANEYGKLRTQDVKGWRKLAGRRD